jgi:hypothetical protein
VPGGIDPVPPVPPVPLLGAQTPLTQLSPPPHLCVESQLSPGLAAPDSPPEPESSSSLLFLESHPGNATALHTMTTPTQPAKQAKP